MLNTHPKEKNLTINSIQVTDKTLAPQTKQLFNGPAGDYIAYIKNVSESYMANCTIFESYDRIKSYEIKPNEAVYSMFSPDSKGTVEIVNQSEKQETDAPKIEIKFYYYIRPLKGIEIGEYYTNSATYYQCPGEYFILFNPFNGFSMDLKICDNEHNGNIQHIPKEKRYKGYYIAQMTSKGIRIYLEDEYNISDSPGSVYLSFYRHVQ